MYEGTLGEIRLFAGNFAPRGWELCQGQSIPIAYNQALFSILGTTFGGDGRTHFKLPDLRGAVPVGVGQSQNLNVGLGEQLPNSQTGAGGPTGLGLNYCICALGLYPARE